MVWKTVSISLVLLSATMTDATAVVYEWRGGTMLTALTQPCIEDGWEIGNYFNTRYRPPSLGENANETRLTLFASFNSHGFMTVGDVGSRFVNTIFSNETSSRPYGYSAGFNKIRFLSRTPTKITTSTKSIEINGEIANFAGVQGCTVGFRSTLGPRP